MRNRHMKAYTEKIKADSTDARRVLLKLQGLYLFMGLAGGCLTRTSIPFWLHKVFPVKKPDLSWRLAHLYLLFFNLYGEFW